MKMVEDQTKGNKEFQHLVRIANTDVKGEKNIVFAMKKIKGVSNMFANAVCRLVGVDTNKRAGDLSTAEVSKIEEGVKNPSSVGVPLWMFNRRNDYETGQDMHLLGGDLQFAKEMDVKKLRKIKTYRGIRHGLRLTVRGQKTKSNFRRQKGKGLGVKKKGKVGKKS